MTYEPFQDLANVQSLEWQHISVMASQITGCPIVFASTAFPTVCPTSQLALWHWPNVGIGRHRRDRPRTSRQHWHFVDCVALVDSGRSAFGVWLLSYLSLPMSAVGWNDVFSHIDFVHGYHQTHRSSALLNLVRGIHGWLVDYPHTKPVMRRSFPCQDAILMWEVNSMWPSETIRWHRTVSILARIMACCLNKWLW